MKLIILNGPCGVGKSTIAESLCSLTPLSYHLDLDAQRRFISQFRKYNKESFEISVTISLAIMDAYLSTGRDVVLDKIFRRKESALEQFIDIGKKNGADIYEFILWADKKTILKRAKDRIYKKDSLLTPEKCEQFWEDLNTFKETRKNAIMVDTQDQTAEQVLEVIKNHLKNK